MYKLRRIVAYRFFNNPRRRPTQAKRTQRRGYYIILYAAVFFFTQLNSILLYSILLRSNLLHPHSILFSCTIYQLLCILYDLLFYFIQPKPQEVGKRPQQKQPPAPPPPKQKKKNSANCWGLSWALVEAGTIDLTIGIHCHSFVGSYSESVGNLHKSWR